MHLDVINIHGVKNNVSVFSSRVSFTDNASKICELCIPCDCYKVIGFWPNI